MTVPAGSWSDLITGSAPLLVLAPHGGRRKRGVQPGDSVNDLHTAGIARELAARLGASALVNHGLDRNETDLNRIGELAAQAPDFLSGMRGLIDSIVDRHGRALVLLVHGWNMVLPGCDIGVGLRTRDGLARGRYPTVGADCMESTVAVLRQGLAGHGLMATLGQRYPAAAADNATQLFSGRHRGHESDDVRRLAELGAAGRVDAMQLEIGIPLRWPGRRCQLFIDSVVDAAKAYPAASRPVARDHGRKAATKAKVAEVGAAERLAEKGYSLQTVLEGGRLSVLFGVEATGPRSMATRLCLLDDDASMSLFVAEGPWDGQTGRYSIAGLTVEADGSGNMTIDFEGPMIAYPRHDAFLDLERGLASAGLEEAAVHLVYDNTDDGFGRVRGGITRGHETWQVEATAAFGRGSRFAAGKGPRTVLRVTEGSLAARRIELAGPLPDEAAELADRDGARWRMRPIAVVPLLREIDGRRLRVSFGTAAVEGEAGSGLAAFESVSVDEGRPG